MKKQYSGKRPVMFYQEAEGAEISYSTGSRVRIFYPDGHTEWASLSFAGPSWKGTTDYYTFAKDPCWATHKKVGNEEVPIEPPKTMEEAIERAQKYDQEEGYPKMEFLGEL